MLSRETPTAVVIAVLFFNGVCRSMQFTCYNTVSFSDVPAEHMNGASTLSSIYFQMSAGFGVAVGAIVLHVASVWFPTKGSSLALVDFQVAFVIMALISVVALFHTLSLPNNAGAHITGHKRR